MTRKRKPTSRLNSLVETKTKDKSVKPLKGAKASTAQVVVLFSNENELLTEEIEGEDFMQDDFKMSFARTSLLIEDYLQFKAARCIQRFVRGWLERNRYRRKRLAAIKIATEWRRFYYQRIYFRKVEETLQQHIEQHFYCAAQKIQAIWRGWWVRHYVHDNSRLRDFQLLAGEDLLYCVAFKMHHLLRTHQIPGVYSLRNSNAFSKVEQLLASLKFKAYNQSSIQAMNQYYHEKEKAKRQHEKSAFATKVPFMGPVSSADKCASFYSAKDVDVRMTKILQTYDKEQTNVLKKSNISQQLPPGKSSAFCSDVVKSMKKWSILSANKFTVDSSVFKKLQNVENFLKEINSKMFLSEKNYYNRGRQCSQNFNEQKTKSFTKRNEKGQELTYKKNEKMQRKTSAEKNLTVCNELPSGSFKINQARSSIK